MKEEVILLPSLRLIQRLSLPIRARGGQAQACNTKGAPDLNCLGKQCLRYALAARLRNNEKIIQYECTAGADG